MFETFGLNYLFTIDGRQTIIVIKNTRVYHRKEYLKKYAIKLINYWYENPKQQYRSRDIFNKLINTMRKLSENKLLLQEY